MCCAFLTLALLGPRFFGAIWWIFWPLRWETAFRNFSSDLWWIWAVLGLVFLPWTTIMYVIVAPGGVEGFDDLSRDPSAGGDLVTATASPLPNRSALFAVN